jgi:hypothetical protein
MKKRITSFKIPTSTIPPAPPEPTVPSRLSFLSKPIRVHTPMPPTLLQQSARALNPKHLAWKRHKEEIYPYPNSLHQTAQSYAPFHQFPLTEHLHTIDAQIKVANHLPGHLGDQIHEKLERDHRNRRNQTTMNSYPFATSFGRRYQ